MSVFSQAVFEQFAGSKPGVDIIDQWDSRVAKVGGKVFSLCNTAPGAERIVFKCAEETFEILTALAGITQAPYFAKRKWVSVSATTDLPEDDLKIYILRSYDMVAASLSKKLQRELGILAE